MPFANQRKRQDGRPGGVALLALLILLGAMPALSSDMYLPALPTVGEDLGASPGNVNLTLVVFFVCMSLSMLIWGPLSDKYGRRPILLWGMGFYIVGSALCVVAGGIVQLVAFRTLQAIGGGAAFAVSIAVIRDSYAGRQRERALASVSVVMMLAPAVAPLMGTAVLSVASWRAVFGLLAIIGLGVFAGCLVMKETLRERSTGNVLRTFSRLGTLLRNATFARLIVLFSLMGVPLFGFIALSSGIYISRFGLSAQGFSIFFGINALLSMIGPVLYFPAERHLGRLRVVTLCLLATVASGLLVVFLGDIGPITFALCVAPGSLVTSMLRPPSMNIMLEQHSRDTGAASSLITCGFTLFGSAGIAVVSLDRFGDKIVALGIAFAVAGFVSVIMWLMTKGSVVPPRADGEPGVFLREPVLGEGAE